MFDIYGNLLIEFQTENEEEIIQIKSHPTLNNDDSFLAALTEDGTFYVFSFELKRNPHWKEMEKEIKQSEKMGMGPVLANSELNVRNNATEASDNETATVSEFKPLQQLADFTYSKRYKQLFHQYQYVPKYKKLKKSSKPGSGGRATDVEVQDVKAYSRTEISIYFNQTAEINKQRKFIWFDTYIYRNKQYFVFQDNLDSFTVIDRKMEFKNLIKTREPQDTELQINSVDA